MQPRALILLVALVPLMPCVASAQERGQFGVAMGYPTSIGLMWHVSERVAIRPEVTFAHSSTEIESSYVDPIIPVVPPTASSDTWNLNVGASLLWYVRRFDTVRTYISPRVAFGRTSSDSSTDPDDPRTSDTLSGSVSFGAQFTPVRKFSVFGEVGYGFSRGSTGLETAFLTGEITGWSWSVRSSAGVVFYFGRN